MTGKNSMFLSVNEGLIINIGKLMLEMFIKLRSEVIREKCK